MKISRQLQTLAFDAGNYSLKKQYGVFYFTAKSWLFTRTLLYRKHKSTTSCCLHSIEKLCTVNCVFMFNLNFKT